MDQEITQLIMRVKNWMDGAGLNVEQRLNLLVILTKELARLHDEARMEEKIVQELYLKKALGGKSLKLLA